jgi:hypothetical protein
MTARDLRYGRSAWSDAVVDPAPPTCTECGRPVTAGALRHATCTEPVDADQLTLPFDGAG